MIRRNPPLPRLGTLGTVLHLSLKDQSSKITTFQGLSHPSCNNSQPQTVRMLKDNSFHQILILGHLSPDYHPLLEHLPLMWVQRHHLKPTQTKTWRASAILRGNLSTDTALEPWTVLCILAMLYFLVSTMSILNSLSMKQGYRVFQGIPSSGNQSMLSSWMVEMSSKLAGASSHSGHETPKNPTNR